MNKLRHLEQELNNHFNRYKQAIILLGARQVGKSTLLKKVFPEALYLLIDNEDTKHFLESYDINTYKQIIGNQKEVILDELHLLSDPGRAVKIIYDQMVDKKIIVTGSSSLHIKNKSTESLAGRKIDYQLYPLTFSEYLVQNEIENDLNMNILKNILEEKKSPTRLFNPSKIVESLLLFGLYPATIQLAQDKKYLLNLADSVVFKDLIGLNLLEDKARARDLLKLLAYQIGNLINYREIGDKLKMDFRTVQKYIEIFEQSFILFRLYPYSANKRNEISKTPKVYFYDLGLRNALINNFDKIAVRSDSGAMFENFIIVETRKIIQYYNLDYNINYWRLKSGSEVDMVLSNNHELFGCEIKLNKGKMTTAFTDRYPQAKTRVINSSNFY